MLRERQRGISPVISTLKTPFDRYPEEYDRWFDEHQEIFSRECDSLRAALTVPGRCLDMGTGSGRFASVLGICHGIDPSLPLIRMAKSRGVGAVLGTGEFLPYRNGSFDTLLMMTVVCFVSDPVPVLREAFRVLRPGGRLVLGVFPADGTIARQALAEDPPGRFFARAHFRSAAAILAALRSGGFTVSSIREEMPGFTVIIAKR